MRGVVVVVVGGVGGGTLILKLYLAELRRLVVSGINHVTIAEGGCGLCCCLQQQP